MSVSPRPHSSHLVLVCVCVRPRACVRVHVSAVSAFSQGGWVVEIEGGVVEIEGSIER
jgi:hypothetical protein